MSIVTDPVAALSQVLISYDEYGNTIYYVYGHGLISQETFRSGEQQGEYLVFHFDHRGNTVALSGTDSNVHNQVGYSAYGGSPDFQQGIETIFLFAGRYGVQTDANGLYYMRARYYSPEMGRFVNEDPIRDGLNWFAYAGGNPITRIDPGGLFWEDVEDFFRSWREGASSIVENLGDSLRTLTEVFTSNGRSGRDEPSTFVALGTAQYDLGRGWTARIDVDLSGGHGLRHVHLERHGEYFAQIETGQPSHAGRWTSGGPPNSIKRELKRQTGWDWDANNSEWQNRIEIRHDPAGYYIINYPDGRTVSIYRPHSTYSMPFSLSDQDLINYSYGSTYIDLSNRATVPNSSIPFVPIPYLVPVPIPGPVLVPVIP